MRRWLLALGLLGLVLVQPGEAVVVPGACRAYATTGTSSAIANTTTFTVFSKTLTLLAGEVNQPGTVVWIRASGYYNTTGTPYMFMELRVGSGSPPAHAVVNHVLTNQTNAVNAIWYMDGAFVVRTGGTSGQLRMLPGLLSPVTAGQPVPSLSAGPFTQNMTEALIIGAGIGWSDASPSNTITLHQLSVLVCPGGTF